MNTTPPPFEDDGRLGDKPRIPLADLEALFGKVHDMVTTGHADDSMGKLAAFAGVHKFPARVKCAILSWHAAKAAVAGGGTVSTEGDEPKAG